MNGTKILLGPSSFGAVDREPVDRLLAGGCQIIENPLRRKLDKGELLDLLAGVEGLIAGLEPLDREVLVRSELRVISRCGSGMSNVDLGAAKERGILVFSTADAPVQAVAELTVGALLTLLRGISVADRKMHGGRWEKFMGQQLADKNVCVVGFGRIGSEVGRLLACLGARVVAVDPAFSGSVQGVPVVDLEAGLVSADVVVLHSSGDECVLGERELGLLPSGSYVLNAARGELVDEAALLEALSSGHLAGAWLDTFSEEPYEGPLCDLDQVLLTPHIGSYTEQCRRRMENEAVDNLLNGLKQATGSRK